RSPGVRPRHRQQHRLRGLAGQRLGHADADPELRQRRADPERGDPQRRGTLAAMNLPMTTRLRKRSLLSAVAVIASLASTAAFSDGLRMSAPLAGNLNVPVISMKEARFVSTLR